jgi:hypothetical protein
MADLSPLEAARLLAGVYGHKLERPVVYTQGVALSGRLRLHELDRSSPAPVPEIARIVAPYLNSPDGIFGEHGGTANFAGVCWADELAEATGDSACADLLLSVAARFQQPSPTEPVKPPLDTDIRVEDFFFAGTLLGRAFRLSGDQRHIETLAAFLTEATATLQPNGLWWHCKASPFFWGRGNAFAAMGFAETLTYLPGDHSSRSTLIDAHLRHLEGLRAHQDASGMWRQVIDRPDSYLEHSATTMIGYSVARGLRLGWLSGEWRDVAGRAWYGVSQRIGPKGELEHVCAGTGPQRDLAAYLDRPYSDGLDDRGGSMALWFAVEMARLEARR